MRKILRIASILTSACIGEKITVNGWVRSIRTGKGIIFIALNDGSTGKNLQVVVETEMLNYDEISHLGTGSSIAVKGFLAESPASGQSIELKAESVTIYGGVDDQYPLQKKHHSFEFLRKIAHLRPRTNTFGAVFRMRSALSFAIHKYFQERGFIYVHTPIITGNDCEGAGELFRVSTLDPSAPPIKDGKADFSDDFFGAESSLTVSGQLEGELYALAFSDIYTFGPTFRAENSNTVRHAAEFWMIEPEIAFADLNDDADLAEDFFRYLCRTALEECREDMEFFDTHIENGLIKKVAAIVEKKFEHITYTDAVKLLLQSGIEFKYPVKWGVDLQTEHERYISEKVVGGPVFVTDYPKDIKAFYMRLNDDGNTVAAMDLLVPKVGEIIGGSQREERLDVLEARIKETGIKPESLWWYLDSRRWGSAPHAGFGMGFERLLMYVSGMENIRDVIPFPRTPGNARF